MEGLKGVLGENGQEEDHWLRTTVAFTLLVQIVIYKLFLETVFWNTVSVSMCAICLFLYYSIIFIGNVDQVASFFQP